MTITGSPPSAGSTARASCAGWWCPARGRAGRVSHVLAAVALLLPGAVAAVCGGGGASSLPPPAAAYLRSYRAPFGTPARMAVDGAGTVYVTDPGLGKIVARAPNGRVLARVGVLARPLGVAVGAAGRVYVGDGASGSVTAFDADWQPVLQLGGGAREFLQPTDLAVDAATGNVYVADSAAHVVKVYSAAGAWVNSFGGPGDGEGLFNYPAGVAVDSTAHQVFVVDQLNYRVQVFDVAGAFQSCFGGQGSAAGQFNMPQSVALDAQGRVYVADAVEGRIQILDRRGGFVGYIGDFGDAPGRLRIPAGLVIDPSNRLFVASANNARLEVFGLDTFVDPETVLPAVIHVEPDPIDRTASSAAIVGYVEVPGYALEAAGAGRVTANGVPAAVSPVGIGDRDGNGVSDLRLEFDRTALLATLPVDGAGTVTLSGWLGAKQFEGSAAVQITSCGPGTICSLGDADPQCNAAVCVAGVGCTIQPKADGAGCEDGNACSIEDLCRSGICVGAALSCDDGNGCTDDACDPTGGCVHTDTTAVCDDGNACTGPDRCAQGMCVGAALSCDDGNGCTDDACDPTGGCVHTDTTAACDDGNACTGPDACAQGVCGGAAVSCDDGNGCTDDACDPTGGCVHTDNAAPCDDWNPGTVSDVCNGAGTCAGQTVTGKYALLRWPLKPDRYRAEIVGPNDWIRGDVCAERLRFGRLARVDGDAVAWSSAGYAIGFRAGNRITGDVVTGGGTLLGVSRATVDGRVDLTGGAGELPQCFAARYRAASRRAEFVTLPATPGFALGSLSVAPGESRRIPAAGSLGAGQIVIDAAGLQLGAASTLTLAGAAATGPVIVRVGSGMMLDRGARIVLEGLPPERVIFVVDGSVALQPQAGVAGSVFATGRVRVGSAGTVAGAILGSSIDLAPSVTVDLHPFTDW